MQFSNDLDCKCGHSQLLAGIVHSGIPSHYVATVWKNINTPCFSSFPSSTIDPRYVNMGLVTWFKRVS